MSKDKRTPDQAPQHQFGYVRTIAADVEETRTVTFVASTASRDRHRTVLNQDGWQLDNFARNGIIGYQHNVYGDNLCTPPNPDDVIGRGRAYVENGELLVDITFEPAAINPQAEKIFRKVLFKSLNAVSVGFLPLGQGRWGVGDEAAGGKSETYYFAGQELLEISVVNLPSNPDAVGRALRDQTSHALMFVKRVLGGDYSFSDIEGMQVGDVLRLLDKVPHGRATAAENEPETPENAPVGRSLTARQAELELKKRR
ncbi:hypothetical protein GCM10027594_18780 [Hymenobacter agri]